MSNVWYSAKNEREKRVLATGIVLATVLHAILFYLFFVNSKNEKTISMPILPTAAPIVVELAPQLESAQAPSVPNSSANEPLSKPIEQQTNGLDHNTPPVITDSQVKVAPGHLDEKKPNHYKKEEKKTKNKPLEKDKKEPERIAKFKDEVSKTRNIQTDTSANKNLKNKAPEVGAESNSSANSLQNWQSMVLAKLQAAKKYPAYALRTRMQDTVLVKFRVNSAGEVSKVTVIKSAGYSLLDSETLSLVARVSPLPKPPETAVSGGYTEITVPVIFVIK